MRVFIVEDHSSTARLIQEALVAAGIEAEVCRHGTEALEIASRDPFDAIILDIMLPGLDGLAVLGLLRDRGIRTPVLLLSARGEVDDRVTGLNAGADDFLPKPFSMEELVARLRAMLRRGVEAVPPVLTLADLSLDTISRRASRGGRGIDLSNREYQLLEYLLRSAGRVCSRMMILDEVWNYDFDPGSNIVDVYVRKLRDKVDGGSDLKLIHSVRGVGYTMRL